MEKIKLDDEKLQELRDAIASHSEPTHYDEVLDDVRERADKHKCLTKLDLGALIAWKRIRASATWVNKLMLTADSEVIDLTGSAYMAANSAGSLTDRAISTRSILYNLPGATRNSKGAFASAIITVLNSDMPVYDSRALAALIHLGVVSEGEDFIPYGQYVSFVDQIRVVGGFASNREVDLGLYWLGG